MPARATGWYPGARVGKVPLPETEPSPMRRLFLAALLGLIPALALAQAPAPPMPQPAPSKPLDPENVLLMQLPAGEVVIELRPDLAPKHVARIKELTRKKFYDGLTFHRVIGGFMAQGGDPKGDGTGGSGVTLPAEFSAESHRRGVASMARARNPNSADSQFFIMLADRPELDGQYTVWGRVVSGMEHVDALKKGNPAANGTVQDPDKILQMRVAADVNPGGPMPHGGPAPGKPQ